MNSMMKRLIVISSLALLLVGCSNGTDKKDDGAGTSDKTASKSKVQMSDDIYDFTIEVEGDVIQLPTSAETIAELGWNTGENLEEKIDPNTRTYGTTFRKDSKKEIDVSFANLSDRTMTIADSFAFKISVYLDTYDKEKVPTVKFSKGITTESTLEEVIAAFGEPTERHDSEYGTSITYQMGDDYYSSYDFRFNKDSDATKQVMSDFSVGSIKLSDDQKEGIVSEVSTDTPAYITEYKMPEKLGSTYKDWQIKYGDKVYALPVPVSVLVDNGWTLLSDDETVAAKNSTYGVKLRYENSTISVEVANYDESPQLISNSMVTSFEYDNYSSKIPFELPGGITQDSTLEEIESVYGKGDLDTEYITSLRYGDYGKGLTFYFDEDGTMSSMDYEYFPDSIQ